MSVRKEEAACSFSVCFLVMIAISFSHSFLQESFISEIVTETFGLTTLAEVLQGFPVAFQVFVDGVALVVWFQTLQHVQEGKVLFRVLQG